MIQWKQIGAEEFLKQHGRIELLPELPSVFDARLAWEVVCKENRNVNGEPNELYWQAWHALSKYFSEFSGANPIDKPEAQ